MTDKTKKTAKKRRPLLTLLGILIGFAAALLIAAIIFPTPVLRYVFARVEAQSGISLTFDRAYFYLAEGSILSIDGLTIRRQHHPESNFDLRADSVRMPAMVPGDFYHPVLVISGLRGTIERTGNEDKGAPKDKRGGHSAAEGGISLQSLLVLDAEVEIIDRTPEKPFHAKVQIDNFYASKSKGTSLFEPYECQGAGQISSGTFGILVDSPEDRRHHIVAEIPINLFAPYAPVLDDIFASGSVSVKVEDRTDATRKKARLTLTLLRDCKIRSADAVFVATIRAALEQLDQAVLPELHELKNKLQRLNASSDSLRRELDKVTQIVDTLKMLAPRDVRDQYDKFKSQYDRVKRDYDEWNTKLETLERELDRVKVGIVEDTFQHFIQSGIPIEIDLQEVDGEWQFDAYATIVRLVEQNYRSIIATEFPRRIQEIQNAVDRLLMSVH